MEKIRRLVCEGEIDSKGYKYDIESLNNALDNYMKDLGIVYQDGKGERHYDPVGIAGGYNKEYMYVDLKDDFELNCDHRISLYLILESVEDMGNYKLAKISEILMIVIGQY